MSRFKTVVPVPLGEIRRIEGKLGAAAKAGILLTASDAFAAGDSTHAQSDGATFALNGAGNNAGVMILMEQQDFVTEEITAERAINTWGRAHVLKSGEEVTVILSAAAAIVSGDLLDTAANGTVVKGTTAPKFTAIETATAQSTGDGLRILARVL
jgi:hypothetical protein